MNRSSDPMDLDSQKTKRVKTPTLCELLFSHRETNILFPCSGRCDTEFRYIEFLKEHNIYVGTIILMDQIYDDDALCSEILSRAPEQNKIIFTKSFQEMLEVVKTMRIDLIVSFGFQIAGPVDFDNLRLSYERNWNYSCCMQELGNLLNKIKWLIFPCLDYDFMSPESTDGGQFIKSANLIIDRLPPSFLRQKLEAC